MCVKYGGTWLFLGTLAHFELFKRQEVYQISEIILASESLIYGASHFDKEDSISSDSFFCFLNFLYCFH